MKIDRYMEEKANLLATNTVMKVVVVALSIVVCVSAYCSYRALTMQRVVILPPVVDEKIEITSKDANDGYLKLFTRYVCSLFTTYSPATINGQFEALKEIAAPDYYAELSGDLEKIKAETMRLDMSSVFYPREIEIRRDKREILVRGIGKKTASHTTVEEGAMSYVIGYRIINGKFFVTGVGYVEE
jgi:conjugal transfer pilus assembly protein TraE